METRSPPGFLGRDRSARFAPAIHCTKETGMKERARIWLWIVCFAGQACCSVAALAEVPRVYFDMPFAVACRDVTPPEFYSANPGQKLIEARFEISSLLTSGDERDLAQY